MNRMGLVSARWSLFPLPIWAACVCATLVFLWSGGRLERTAGPRDLFDAGTHAAIRGDVVQAVVNLRSAQRISPGLLPIGAIPTLTDRIDANLAEVRARVDAARQRVPADGEVGAGPAQPVRTGPGVSENLSTRPLSDRLVAALRAVPWMVRLWSAGALTGLLVTLAAMRSFRVAAGLRPLPGVRVLLCAAVAASAAVVFATVDRVVDARRIEAVLVRPEISRTGPDDLTHPPSVQTAWPVGTEFLILGVSDDGRWARVRRADSPRLGDAAVATHWVPVRSLECIGAELPTPRLMP